MNIKKIGNEFVSNLKEAFPFFQGGYLAEIYIEKDGNIRVFALRDGKRSQMLSNDIEGNYFYLYFGDDQITFGEGNSIIACQKGYEISVPAKLIFWAYKADIYNLFLLVNNFIISNALLQGNTEITINSVNMNAKQIMLDEIGNLNANMKEGLVLLSYDLTFSAPFVPIIDPTCLEEIKICTDC